MKAVICTKYGPPEVLQLKDIEKPAPGKNEVLIKLKPLLIEAIHWNRLSRLISMLKKDIKKDTSL